MNTQNNFVLIVIVLITSCTSSHKMTTGPHFQKGYTPSRDQSISKSTAQSLLNASSIRREIEDGTINIIQQKEHGESTESVENESDHTGITTRSSGISTKKNSHRESIYLMKDLPEASSNGFIKEKLANKILNKIDKKVKKAERVSADEPKMEKLGLVGFILGLTGALSLFGAPFLLFLGIPALILGIMSLNKFKKNPEAYKGKGLAITSIVLGAIELTIIALAIILLIAFILAM